MPLVNARKFLWACICVLVAVVPHCTCLAPTSAAPITWVGGNNNWIDGAANNANWNPADEPDADDEAIFNTNNAVDLGSNNEVVGLTMSGGIDLDTDDFDLTVDGLVQLSGASTNLFIRGAQSEVNAEDATINAGGTIELGGGSLTLNDGALFGLGVLNVNGGSFVGHGAVTMVDAPLVASSLLNNNGTITAVTRVLIVGQNPPANTLSITAAAATARIDLDGSGENGVVNVNRNQTLDVNGTLTDEFNGTMSMAQNTRLDVSTAWTLGAGGAINVDNGESLGIPTIQAGTTIISGGALTQTGGTITLVDGDGTLQFDAPFTMNGGNFVANGHVIFNADATIGAGANFTRPTSSSNITVEAGRTLTINQPNFDLDGFLTADTFITVNAGATLVANLGDYDPDQVTNSYSSTINLNNGDMNVTTGDPQFVMNGVLNMHSSMVGQITSWTGEAFHLGNDSGELDSDLNVTGTQQTQFGPAVTFNSDADVDVAAGATLALLGTVNFNTVNAANNAQFTGAGRIAFSGQVNVNEAVTLNMVGGEIDLDGLDAAGDFINIDAPLVINAETMANFGKVNGGGGINTLDVNNSAGTGVLTVNLDNPAAEWTLNGPGVMNLVNDNTAATLLAGNDVNINGTVNVTGDVRTTARLDIAGIININTANEPLRLAGGDNGSDANTISGGTISGAGLLGADSGRALRGFGTINTGVDFDNTARLRADDGTLTINGAILDVGVIGTADSDGVLNVTNAWNNGVATGVALLGGTVQGGEITNDSANGIQGFGLVTARVVNNTSLLSFNGGTLVFETAGNDNDWDGATNAGTLQASPGTTLELRDVGPAFGFTGTVHANGGRVYTNGFGLDFNPGSTLHLTGGTFESTQSTDIGGTVTVGGASASTIRVQNNSFLIFETGSATTLNEDLRLENNNIIIEAGATFAGGGTLIVPDGSHIAPDNLAEINVGFQLAGSLRPAQINDVARVEFLDYQQTSTGKLYVDLTGTGLGDIDRLVVNGTAVIDGFLEIDLDDGFEPALGNTFPIITAAARLGEFDYYDIENINEMPDGLTFKINYLPNAVQLEVVVKEFFEADFDEDGDVDLTDYGMWKSAFGLNQIGDANGDNVSDAADYTIWRNQLGSVSGGGAGSLLALEQIAVPEPGVGAMAVLAFIVTSSFRRGGTSSRMEPPVLCRSRR